MTLIPGYPETPSGSLTVSGYPTPTVTQDTDWGGKIIYDPATNKFDVKPGLAAGSYPVVLTFSNGVQPDAKYTFTVTVSGSAPGISGGWASARSYQGYPAYSTAAFTLTGNPAPTVAVTNDTSGGKITWNSAKNTIDVAAGLLSAGAAGDATYSATFKISNGVSPDASYTYVFKVANPQLDWALVGSAQYVSANSPAFDNVRITPGGTNLVGGIWSRVKADLTKPFTISWVMNLGPNATVADGITFVMQNDSRGISALGAAGRNVGYNTSGDYPGTFIQKALALEFDTFNNQGNWTNDPTMSGYNSHVAFAFPMTNQQTSNHISPQFFNAIVGDAPASVTWTPSGAGGVLSYNYNNGQLTGSYTVSNASSTFGATTAYWGFVGSTGDATASQTLRITGVNMGVLWYVAN